MAVDVSRLNRLIKRAAKSAGNAWLLTPGQIGDLSQNMWVGYLEEPTRQRALEGVTDREAVRYLRGHADQVLSGTVRADDLAAGDRMYSSEAIKSVLKEAVYNPFLTSIVHLAVARLGDRHPPYAEALKLRYIDGITPPQGAAAVRLTAAHQALAEEVHTVVSELDSDRSSVEPDSISANRGPSDPTGDLAARLVDDGHKDAGDGLTYRGLHELLSEPEPIRQGDRLGARTVVVCPVCLFDPQFGGIAHAEMYRGWVIPELYPNEKQPLLSNWDPQDLEMFIGGQFTPGYDRKETA